MPKTGILCVISHNTALSCLQVNNLYYGNYDSKLLSENGDKLYKNDMDGKVVSIRVGKNLVSLQDVRRLNEKEGNAKWLFKNYDGFMKKHLGKFVAVKDESVIGVNKNYESLISKLQKEYGKDFCTIAIEYITKKETDIYPY